MMQHELYYILPNTLSDQHNAASWVSYARLLFTGTVIFYNNTVQHYYARRNS